jgi:hypothetical protein
VGDVPPHDDSDDYDALAALDYSYDPAAGDVEASDLDALAEYQPVAGYADDEDDEDGAVAVDPRGGAPLYLVSPPEAQADDDATAPTFVVTNPPGTVTVTTFLDGRVRQIELSPKVTAMTEAELADEIVVIAELATMDARSAQYAFMLDGMREHGHSDVATRDFLTRDLELPSPEQADARRAEVFATRYEGSHE